MRRGAGEQYQREKMGKVKKNFVCLSTTSTQLPDRPLEGPSPVIEDHEEATVLQIKLTSNLGSGSITVNFVNNSLISLPVCVRSQFLCLFLFSCS